MATSVSLITCISDCLSCLHLYLWLSVLATSVSLTTCILTACSGYICISDHLSWHHLYLWLSVLAHLYLWPPVLATYLSLTTCSSHICIFDYLSWQHLYLRLPVLPHLYLWLPVTSVSSGTCPVTPVSACTCPGRRWEPVRRPAGWPRPGPYTPPPAAGGAVRPRACAAPSPCRGVSSSALGGSTPAYRWSQRRLREIFFLATKQLKTLFCTNNMYMSQTLN
jgi:hypothetical protein